jgi:tetratricopeptide (TPR) repeat protein
MNSQDPRLARAASAAQAGDLPAAALAFDEAAEALAATSPADAVLALESLCRIRLIEGALPAAQAALARIDALGPPTSRTRRLAAEVADAAGDPVARRTAWRAFADLASTAADRSEAHAHLALIAREANDLTTSVAEIDAALEAHGASADPLVVSALLLERAISAGALQWFEVAVADLDRAEAGLSDLADDGGLRARILGHRGVVAMASGEPAAALAYAEASRDAAVAASDVTTYLAAASLIALVHEHAGRLVDAYDTLMRAKASIGDLLGRDAQGLISPAIGEFEARLGPSRFKEVWDAWVASRRRG